MDNINIIERPGEDYTLLEVIGTINSYTYDRFQQSLQKFIKTVNLVLDMSKVSHVSSSGLGVLLAAIEEGQELGNKLYILAPSAIVRLAIDSTGFSDYFQIINTTKEIR